MLLTRNVNKSALAYWDGLTVFTYFNGKGVRAGKWNYRFVSLPMILFSDRVSRVKSRFQMCQFALLLLPYCSEISF